MRSTLLYTSSALILASLLSGCSVVGGALVGGALFGGGEWDLEDWEISTLSAGTSVVCLGTDAEVEPADSYTINGVIVRDEYAQVDVGNVIPCAEDPYRVLTVRDMDGVEWEIGYAWIGGDGWDSTPAVPVWEDTRVEVVVRTGASDDTQSAGFAVYDSEGLAYAMESGIGEPALSVDDLPLSVASGNTMATLDSDDCGSTDTVTIDFESSDDALSLLPGEDEAMYVDGEYYTACNINSVVVEGDCGEVDEVSWVMFR